MKPMTGSQKTRFDSLTTRFARKIERTFGNTATAIELEPVRGSTVDDAELMRTLTVETRDGLKFTILTFVRRD